MNIEELTIPEFLLRVRVGSDDRTWWGEINHLLGEEAHVIRVNQIEADMEIWGQIEPVLIGPDGRLWDGHHRAVILLCWYFGIDQDSDESVKIKVEYA